MFSTTQLTDSLLDGYPQPLHTKLELQVRHSAAEQPDSLEVVAECVLSAKLARLRFVDRTYDPVKCTSDLYAGTSQMQSHHSERLTSLNSPEVMLCMAECQQDRHSRRSVA